MTRNRPKPTAAIPKSNNYGNKNQKVIVKVEDVDEAHDFDNVREDAVANEENEPEVNEKNDIEEMLGTKKFTTKNKTEAEADKLIREKFGYEMKNILGKGGFGVVKKAFSSRRGDVAIKIILLNSKKDEKFSPAKIKQRRRKKFKELFSECYALEHLKHENKIDLYEHFMIDEVFYIVMEYSDGGTLADIVKKSKDILSESKVRRWFTQMCKAVHYMHSKGWSHRDLKLANVLLKKPRDSSGAVTSGHRVCKVTDFGLSRICWSQVDGPHYFISFGGTTVYMAPEIFEADLKQKPYNPMKADIWALGVCLYAMLCRAYPFNPGNNRVNYMSVVEQMKSANFKYPKKVRRTISEKVKDLIANMLKYDVDERITFQGIFTHEWMKLINRKNVTDSKTDSKSTATKPVTVTTTANTIKIKQPEEV